MLLPVPQLPSFVFLSVQLGTFRILALRPPSSLALLPQVLFARVLSGLVAQVLPFSHSPGPRFVLWNFVAFVLLGAFLWAFLAAYLILLVAQMETPNEILVRKLRLFSTSEFKKAEKYARSDRKIGHQRINTF